MGTCKTVSNSLPTWGLTHRLLLYFAFTQGKPIINCSSSRRPLNGERAELVNDAFL